MIIDTHHHFMPREIGELLFKESKGSKRLVNDKISITLTDKWFGLDTRLRDMDEGSIDMALLGMSGISVYGNDYCRLLNDAAAQAVKAHPDRFIGSAHIAVFEEQKALEELTRAVEGLDLKIVSIPTSTFDMDLDHPIMDKYYEKIEKWGLPILLHPALLPQGADTSYFMERSLAREFDILKAVVIIMYSVLKKYPKLKFILPHVGGGIPFLKGRIKMFFEPEGYEIPPQLQQKGKTHNMQKKLGFLDEFEKRFDNLYFDICGHGAWPPALESALQSIRPDRLLFGTDYPVESKDGEELNEYKALVSNSPSLSRAGKEDIYSRNFCKLINSQL